MLTQLATQTDIATQTVQYTNDLSTLTVGLIVLLGVSASMIVVTTLHVRFAPIFRVAMEIHRFRHAQEHAA
jgi:hypothetical protein